MDVPILKGAVHYMTNKEKLIQYIHNLSNDEADYIISYLKESASIEDISPLLLQYSSLRKQEVVV